MSYTVLAVKWRPRRFEQLVGQAHVVQALVNSLEHERVHHAYLFAGTRGVGKTTLARILAKALNCEKGIVAEPCGECEACVAIDEGRFVDLIEVDAASRTKVDDTRELLDNVQYMPTRGRFKVYLIDEVHMLSNHSFNALLKTLEEPPPHVKFLFATTDPQKLPVTVLSRCLQFNLKKLPLQQIQEQLERICSAEDVAAEPAGLRAIAKAAEGSVRDALSLLDQAIAFGGGEIQAEQVGAMLGTIDRNHILRILDALIDQDGARIVEEVEQLDALAPDFGGALDDILSTLQQVAVLQLVPEARSQEEMEAFVPYAERLSPEDTQLYYQIALHGRRDLEICRDERMGFEMTLLRMLAFRPVTAAEAGAAQPDAEPAARRAPAESGTASRAQPNAPGQASAARARVEAPEKRPANVSDASWSEIIEAAEVRGAARQLAENCVLTGSTGSRIELVLAADKAEFNTEQLRERLRTTLGRYLGREVKLDIKVGTPPEATPAERRVANENERLSAAREAISRDATVRAMQSTFDAVVEPDSIQPTERQGKGHV